MRKVYEVHQRWVEYGEPCGPGDYYDKYGTDVKATFGSREEAEAFMRKSQAELPNETFEIWTVDEPPSKK